MWIAEGFVAVFTCYHLIRLIIQKPFVVFKDGQERATVNPHRQANTEPVTFLVAAWNAAGDIADFLISYDSLSLVDKQMVICCGGADETHAVTLGLTHSKSDIVVLEQLPGMGKQRALRAAYPYATGEYIYLTDVDCILDDVTVHRMIHALDQDGCDCATGSIRPLPSQMGTAFVRAQWAVERVVSYRMPDQVNGLRGANAVLRREAVEASGAFSQDAFTGTDYTLAKELLRVGGTIAFVQDAEMQTRFPDDFLDYIRRQSRWLKNVVTLSRRYKEQADFRSSFLTFAVSLGYLGLLALGFLLHPLWFFLILGFFHSVFNRLRYSRAAKVSVALPSVGLFVLADVAAALRALWQVLTRKSSW